MTSLRRLQAPALLVLGLVSFATLEPGLFTIDEPNYLATLLATRAGLPHVPGVDGLPASAELAYYDPVDYATPTRPKLYAPPLYAFFALPFASLLGVRGLFLLNVLALLFSTGVVFRLAERNSTEPRTPWLVAAVYALGAYNLEYAQGIWPHMLAVALCTGAFAATLRAQADPALRHAVVAGLLVGLATGVRYQEAVYGLLLGLSLLAWAPARLRASAGFALGMAGPLALSAALNQFRFGELNPISKGSGYLSVGAATRDFGVLEPLRVLWTRVVDYSSHPSGTFSRVVFEASPHSPAYVYVGAVKKAWLQSIPWALLALAVLALSLRPVRAVGAAAATPRTRPLQTAALLSFGTLAMFAVMGYARIDGLCFNQRYFLELVPLACLALGSALEQRRPATRDLIAGAVAGGLLVLGTLKAAPPALEERLLLWFPLLAGLALLAAYAAARHAVGSRAFGLALGLCVGWAAGVHLGDDLPASRNVRQRMARRTQLLERALPASDPSALFVLGYWVNAAAPLQLERPLLIADALRDELHDAPGLVRALVGRGRRVFVLNQGFRPEELSSMAAGLEMTPVPSTNAELLEIRQK
jgi:hypothetical protein